MSDTNKEIVKKINTAFQENRPEAFLDFCTDEIEWRMVGDREFSGKVAIREFMSQMEGMEPPTFAVDEIIADGDSAACYGDMKMKMETDDKPTDYSYVDVYRFSDGKVARLQSFVVKHKTEDEKTDTAVA